MSCNCHGCHEHHHDHHHHESKDIKSELTVKLLGVIFFILGFVIKSYSIYMFLMSYVLLGYDIIFSAVNNAMKGHFFDENFLMFVASIGAFIIGDYPEAIAVMFFYSVGEFFQDKAVSSSRERIKNLMALKQDFAILSDGTKVEPEVLKPGDVITVRPGEKFPVDCRIISGNGYVDTSSITGEAVPFMLNIGDNATSGYINTESVFTAEVTCEYKNSTVAKIIDLIENSSATKSGAENFITKFSKIYTPAVILLAALIILIPPFFMGFNTFSQWVYRGLTFLIISCPCALVLSVPLSFFSAVGACSSNGVLVRGSGFISALSDTSAVILDKTGTLTKGRLKVKNFVCENVSEDEFRILASYAEYNSNHPLAEAVRTSFQIDINPELINGFKETPGMGTEVTYNGKKLHAGNLSYMNYLGITPSLFSDGGTVIYIAYGERPVGYIEFEDELRNDAPSFIKALKRRRIKTVMLTGDSETTAANVANKLGIKKYFYGLLPHQKVEKITSFKNDFSGNVVFIGDGINDAPSLKNADIGVSMGGIGSDAAVEASDIVLIKDNISSLIKAIDISRKTRRIVFENIVFILLVKIAVLALTAIGFTYMWMAVIADVGTALLAVLNTLRIKK